LNYATAVFHSDPQRNVIFGFTSTDWRNGFSTVAQMDTIFAELAALS